MEKKASQQRLPDRETRSTVLLNVIWFSLAFLILSFGWTTRMFGEELPQIIRPPQHPAPPAGTTVHEQFPITLDEVMNHDCVSLIHNQATLLISHPLLVQLKANILSEWTTEEERQALIQGRQAKALLAQLTTNTDGFGCRTIDPPAPNDSWYLLGKLLDAGQIGVVDNETGQPLKEIVVTYSGIKSQPHGGFGQIMYAFTPRASPFLVLSWWVS